MGEYQLISVIIRLNLHFMTNQPDPKFYQLYVYFKCAAESQAAMLALQHQLARHLQAEGHRAARLQYRPYTPTITENMAAAAQTWMEVYDEVDVNFISWLEQQALVQQLNALSLQGRHAEVFLSHPLD